MSMTGEYAPSPSEWISNQAAKYEASNGVASDLPVPMTPLLPLLLKGSVDSRTGSRSPTPLQGLNLGEQSFTG